MRLTGVQRLPTVVLIALLAGACASRVDADVRVSPQSGGVPATVVQVVDGDTVIVRLPSGEDETVRLIGVDAPEAGECHGDEATRALEALLPVGSSMSLTADVSDRDRYGRLLRYLWVGDFSINRELVVRGEAVARRYPPDTAMAEQLARAESMAAHLGLGLWAAEACEATSRAGWASSMSFEIAPGLGNRHLLL